MALSQIVDFAEAAARVRQARLRRRPEDVWTKLWLAGVEAQLVAWRALCLPWWT